MQAVQKANLPFGLPQTNMLQLHALAPSTTPNMTYFWAASTTVWGPFSAPDTGPHYMLYYTPGSQCRLLLIGDPVVAYRIRGKFTINLAIKTIHRLRLWIKRYKIRKWREERILELLLYKEHSKLAYLGKNCPLDLVPRTTDHSVEENSTVR